MDLRWLICVSLLVMAPVANANTFELLTNAYSIFVSGGRLLHDVAGGLGLVSKVVRTFDYFLDYSAQEEIKEALEDSESPTEESTASTPEKEEKVKEPLEPPTSSSEPPQQGAGGCGVLGLQISDESLPVAGLTECCNEHDACYASACKVKKGPCDKELGKCLKRACDDLTLEWLVQKNCQGAAKLLYSGTMALSSQQYSDAQSKLSCREQKGRNGR